MAGTPCTTCGGGKSMSNQVTKMIASNSYLNKGNMPAGWATGGSNVKGHNGNFGKPNVRLTFGNKK